MSFKPNVSAAIAVAVAAAAGGLWMVKCLYSHAAAAAKLRRLEQTWNEKRDVVIVHTLPRAKTAPNASPFAVKLETYLRMTGIPYEVDHEVPFGSKGKTPWITFNGQALADSQIISERLAENLKKSVGNYSAREKSIARAVRLMMEEHVYWGLGLWRYVYSDCDHLSKFMSMPLPALRKFYKSANARVIKNAWCQGLGRHSQDFVIDTIKADLLAVSMILGNRKFILGDEPCEEDCSVFGFLVQILFCAPGSPYESYVNDELQNLADYAKRMQDLYWPDWNTCTK